MDPTTFATRAQSYWTPEREAKITGGKAWLVRPSTAPQLLRTLGLLNRDASMSADALRKFSQINHMLTLLAPQLRDLADRHPKVRLLDACCGTSYLTLLAAWLLHDAWSKPCEIIGIDSNPKVIQTSVSRAQDLGYGDFVRFAVDRVEPSAWSRVYAQLFPASASAATNDGTDAAPAPSADAPAPRPHAVIALHACDTATDHAIATAVSLKADLLAVAPCCHAELARKWQSAPSDHPFEVIFKTPNLRRETAAHLTDAMRLLLIRSRGYEVTATEFVPSAHTPKNRLLLCIRRGNYLRDATDQFTRLKAAMADQGIILESLLPASPA